MITLSGVAAWSAFFTQPQVPPAQFAKPFGAVSVPQIWAMRHELTHRLRIMLDTVAVVPRSSRCSSISSAHSRGVAGCGPRPAGCSRASASGSQGGTEVVIVQS